MKKKEPISLFNVFAEHSKDNHLGLKTKNNNNKEEIKMPRNSSDERKLRIRHENPEIADIVDEIEHSQSEANIKINELQILLTTITKHTRELRKLI